MEIAIVGARPTDMPREEFQELRGINARVLTYDELISSSLREYQEYLDATDQVSRLANLLDRLQEPEGDSS